MVYSGANRRRNAKLGVVRSHRKAHRSHRRKTNVPRGISTGRQVAKIQETFQVADLNPNQSVQCAFNLSQFARAMAIAPNFRWYRAAKVIWKIEPLYNTFQEGSTTSSTSIPYYYAIMNRTQDSRPQVVADYLECGAQPKKLVAPIVTSYKPNWCSLGLPVQNLTGGRVMFCGLKAQYGWQQCPIVSDQQPLTQPVVPTNPMGAPYGPVASTTPSNFANATLYNGHDVIIDQEFPTTPTLPVARMTCTVHWEFKDPASYVAPRVTITDLSA